MSGWVKLPDNWLEGDEIERLGSEAVLLHLSALSYSCRHGSDGRLPDGALRRLWPVSDLDTAVKVLVAAGEWERTDSGWFLLNWATHLLARSEVEHRRQVSRETSERYRRHKAGDHSRCERCSFVKASRDTSRDRSDDVSVTSLVSQRLDSPRREAREVRREENADARTGSAEATPADAAEAEQAWAGVDVDPLTHPYTDGGGPRCEFEWVGRQGYPANCSKPREDPSHGHPYQHYVDPEGEDEYCDECSSDADHPVHLDQWREYRAGAS